MIGGLAESRYLSMDKLKTRGVLLAYKSVSIVEGMVHKKGNLLDIFVFVIDKYVKVYYRQGAQRTNTAYVRLPEITRE